MLSWMPYAELSYSHIFHFPLHGRDVPRISLDGKEKRDVSSNWKKTWSQECMDYVWENHLYYKAMWEWTSSHNYISMYSIKMHTKNTKNYNKWSLFVAFYPIIFDKVKWNRLIYGVWLQHKTNGLLRILITKWEWTSTRSHNASEYCKKN